MIKVLPLLLVVLYAFLMMRFSVWRTRRMLDEQSVPLTDPSITRLADRIVLLHAGRLLFSGAPAALCDALGAADLESAFVECVARTAGDARRPQDAPPRSPSP